MASCYLDNICQAAGVLQGDARMCAQGTLVNLTSLPTGSVVIASCFVGGGLRDRDRDRNLHHRPYQY